MMISLKKITGIILIVSGLLFVLESFPISFLSANEIISYSLLAFGIPAVYISLNLGNRALLVFASIVFMIGILLLIQINYEIIDTRGIVFVSILLITGSISFMLFLENTSQKIFLLLAVVFLLLGYLSVTMFKKMGLLILSNKIANYAEDIWPIALLLTGLFLFLNRKK
ncbi:MAG: hypothetical protein FJ214_05405 [Ignavibacteria bacterium]|nr:hypothetical protein [Ignavibacteria bacterium]